MLELPKWAQRNKYALQMHPAYLFPASSKDENIYLINPLQTRGIFTDKTLDLIHSTARFLEQFHIQYPSKNIAVYQQNIEEVTRALRLKRGLQESVRLPHGGNEIISKTLACFYNNEQGSILHLSALPQVESIQRTIEGTEMKLSDMDAYFLYASVIPFPQRAVSQGIRVYSEDISSELAAPDSFHLPMPLHPITSTIYNVYAERVSAARGEFSAL